MQNISLVAIHLAADYARNEVSVRQLCGGRIQTARRGLAGSKPIRPGVTSPG